MNRPLKLLVEKRIAVILCVLFVFALFYAGIILTRAPSSKDAAKQYVKKKLDIDKLINKQVIFQEGLRRDPLQKPKKIIVIESREKFPVRPEEDAKKKDGQENNFLLSGIISGGGKEMAIISGKIVREGDDINGAKVAKIDKDGVVLVKDGVEIKLTRRGLK